MSKIACSFVYFCCVQIEVVKSKLHRITITGADLHYIGSITIDQNLLDAAHMISGEKVVVVNVNNGSRLETYIIPGERGSGEVTMNGPAARLVQKGDVVIVFSYALMEFEEAKAFKPWVIFPDEGSNSLK